MTTIQELLGYKDASTTMIPYTRDEQGWQACGQLNGYLDCVCDLPRSQQDFQHPRLPGQFEGFQGSLKGQGMM